MQLQAKQDSAATGHAKSPIAIYLTIVLLAHRAKRAIHGTDVKYDEMLTECGSADNCLSAFNVLHGLGKLLSSVTMFASVCIGACAFLWHHRTGVVHGFTYRGVGDAN